MKFFVILFCLLSVVGCVHMPIPLPIFSKSIPAPSKTPYEELNLDTTSNFRTPSVGNAGVYVYQWKTGLYGSAFDVDFEIKGFPKISLNTGEYSYFEIAPGEYEYKYFAGTYQQIYLPVTFEANKNYFFHASLYGTTDNAILIREQKKIDEAKQNILNGRYELHTID